MIQFKFNPLTGKFDQVSVEDLSNLVPYSGATSNVNLGIHELTSAKVYTSEINVGKSPNYLKVDEDGNLTLYGNATQFRDELNDLVRQGLNNPSDHIVQNFTEATLDFKTTCDLSDYAIMNIQINHDYKLGGEVHPHIHWIQANSGRVNWLLQYRWQHNGTSKVTSWTNLPLTNNVFTYSSGSIIQITNGAELTPDPSINVSSILQFRVIRDVANTSGLFSGADNYTGTVSALSFDVHIEIDSFGSNLEYSKEIYFLVDELGNFVVDEFDNYIVVTKA